MRHKLRRRVGATLAVASFFLSFVEGLLWIREGGRLHALLILLGLGGLAFGMWLLGHKRSV